MATGRRIRLVVGAPGRSGLSLAIDLAQRAGQGVVLLDDVDRIRRWRARARSASRNARWSSGTGSGSASVWSKRAWCGASARFFTARRNCISSICCRRRATGGPLYINLQQFYAEAYLVDRRTGACGNRPRWRNKVIGLEQRNDPCSADN